MSEKRASYTQNPAHKCYTIFNSLGLYTQIHHAETYTHIHADPSCRNIHADPSCRNIHADPSCRNIHADPSCRNILKIILTLLTMLGITASFGSMIWKVSAKLFYTSLAFPIKFTVSFKGRRYPMTNFWIPCAHISHRQYFHYLRMPQVFLCLCRDRSWYP
jgi:hypothetical protein